METTILCPECRNLAYYNSHFGAYLCSNCKWEDKSPARRRTEAQYLLHKVLVGEKISHSNLKMLLRMHK